MIIDDDDNARRDPSRRRKRRSPHYKANNEGGYGNPPVRPQFKPGNPGGPGKPKGMTTITAALGRMYRSHVPANKAGKKVKISMNDAVAESLKKQILGGNLKAIELGIKLARTHGPAEPANDPMVPDFSEWKPEQVWAFRKFLMTFTGDERHQVIAQIRVEMEERRDRIAAAKAARDARRARLLDAEDEDDENAEAEARDIDEGAGGDDTFPTDAIGDDDISSDDDFDPDDDLDSDDPLY